MAWSQRLEVASSHRWPERTRAANVEDGQRSRAACWMKCWASLSNAASEVDCVYDDHRWRWTDQHEGSTAAPNAGTWTLWRFEQLAAAQTSMAADPRLAAHSLSVESLGSYTRVCQLPPQYAQWWPSRSGHDESGEQGSGLCLSATDGVLRRCAVSQVTIADLVQS